MNYMLVDPTTGTIILLDKNSFIVPLNDDEVANLSNDQLLDAADNTSLTVIPVIETIEL